MTLSRDQKRHQAKSIQALFLGLLLVSTLPSAARAQENGAVDIEANEMEILETDKRAIFRGDVVAKRPSDTIRCAEMVVTYVEVKKTDGSSGTEVDQLDCKGSTTIATASQTITGDLAVFYVRRDQLVVTGNAKVVQGKTVVRGPKLMVDLKTKVTKMTGGRVKGTFVPK